MKEVTCRFNGKDLKRGDILVNLSSWAIGDLTNGLIQPGSYLNSNEFTYTIPINSTEYLSVYGLSGGEPSTGFAALTSAQASNFISALRQWDFLIAPNFTQGSWTSSTIRVAFTSYEMSGNAGYAYYAIPGLGTGKGSDIWINSADQSQKFNRGSYEYQTFLHEIGHALGLKHSFDATALPAALDDTNFTVMAYNDPVASLVYTFSSSNNSYTYSASYVTDVSPMVADIAAIQSLYGADPNTNITDTVYSFSQSNSYRQAIYDAGGNDTLNLSSFSRPVILDLNDGAYSSIGYYSVADQIAYWQALYPQVSSFIRTSLSAGDAYTWSDNLGIAIGTDIENAVGGTGDDLIRGNELDNGLTGGAGNDVLSGDVGDDVLDGGLGDDFLDGGAGDDTASYLNATNAVHVQLWGGMQNTGSAGQDTLIAIENLTGSAFADTLLGDGFVNTLNGGDGDDWLFGDIAPDWIYGEAGNDMIVALGDGDVIDGGAGKDTAEYSELARGLGASASGEITSVGLDQIISVENIHFKDALLTFDVDSDAAFIMRLYDSVLSREPDAPGFDYWNDFILDGGTRQQVASAFLGSPEFSPSAGLSNGAFVEFLYTQTLGRASDPGGKAYWVNLLASGTSRAEILLGFSESPEHQALTQSTLDRGLWLTNDDYQFVEILYDAFNKRLPDATGLQYWVGQIEAGASHNAVATGFATSPEFTARTAGFTNDQLVDFMYVNSLGRAADSSGKQYWLDQLAHGATKGDLLLNFATSAEHIASLEAHLYSGVDFVA